MAPTKSLLEIVQDFTARVGLTKPSSLFNSPDDTNLQYIALCNEGLDDLSSRFVWQMQQLECTFLTKNQEDQGDIDTLAPFGFMFIHNQEVFNRTLNLIVNGPCNAHDWQLMKAANIQGPLTNWRMRGGHFLMYPVPPADQMIAFEYISNFCVLGGTSQVRQEYFTTDLDLFLLPPKLLTAYLSWRWKKVKGFDYDEDFRLYETLCTQAASNDNEGKTLNMSGGGDTGPGIMVPVGSFVQK